MKHRNFTSAKAKEALLKDKEEIEMKMVPKPIIAWFSCGATSAVACKIGLSMYDNVRVVYIETGSSHPDNKRFLRDCENWFGVDIEILRSDKFADVDDVLLKKRYINGPHGASCTSKLKKDVRYAYEDAIGNWGGQIWGFDYCEREINRAIRFKQQNPSTKPLFPLIEKMITKEDALGMLKMAGIEIPTMYKLGYNNNNCIGCVKGGIGYWNKIRRDFPERFKRMAEIERIVGATCLKDADGKRIYLDELEPDRGNDVTAIIPDCSLFCQIEFQEILDKQTRMVMEGKLKISEIR